MKFLFYTCGLYNPQFIEKYFNNGRFYRL